MPLTYIRLDFGKLTKLSYQAYSILLLQLYSSYTHVLPMHDAITNLPVTANWFAFLE